MSRAFILGDISLHAGDVQMLARELEYHAQQKDEAKVRESLSRVLEATDRLRSDLSSLNFRVQREQAEAELKRNPQPPTMSLPLTEGGAS